VWVRVIAPVEVGMVMSRSVVCVKATWSELKAVAVTSVGVRGWVGGRECAGTRHIEEPVSARAVQGRGECVDATDRRACGEV
jgi:hypothetical protein